MLVVFSFCHKDAAAALKQAQWIKELGGASQHNAMLACNQKARFQELDKPILDVLSSCFNFAEVYTPFDEEESEAPGFLKHARAANHMWVRVVQRIRDARKDVPFLWMESDAIPKQSDWLDVIEAQFAACGKPFMGDSVLIPGVPVHMSGVGVYHQTWRHVPHFACVGDIAWDVALSPTVVPLMHRTKLIQHEWKPASFGSFTDLSRIRPEAVVYHQCKDGSLIDRLRESRVGVPAAQPSSLAAGAGSTPAPATPDREAILLKRIEDLSAQLEEMGRRRFEEPTAPKKHRGMSPERKAALSAKMKAKWKAKQALA